MPVRRCNGQLNGRLQPAAADCLCNGLLPVACALAHAHVAHVAHVALQCAAADRGWRMPDCLSLQHEVEGEVEDEKHRMHWLTK
jgi:hypothetical protein